MLKRGTKITYTDILHAEPRIVSGIIIKAEALPLYRSHGPDLWYRVRFTDEAGRYTCVVHHSTVTPAK